MSGLLAGKVWHSALDPDLKPLAATLADIGDDDGTSIYPSVGFVAWRLGRAESSVRDGLRKLRECGVLIVVAQGGGRSKTTEYRMDENALPKRPRWVSKPSDNRRESESENPPVWEPKPSGLGPETLRPTGGDPSVPVIDPPSTNLPAKLALPKPETRKSKTQRARERFFARRGAEAHPDEGRRPDTRKAPTTAEDVAAPHPSEDRTAASPKAIHELYKEARRIFKSRTGHVLGTLGQKSGEEWVEAYEKHGGDVLIRAFEAWVEAEKRFVGKMDYPIARFLKAVDEWAQDATTPVAPDDDPNAGLALTEQGRRMYEKYAGKAP